MPGLSFADEGSGRRRKRAEKFVDGQEEHVLRRFEVTGHCQAGADPTGGRTDDVEGLEPTDLAP